MLKILRWDCYQGQPVVLCGAVHLAADALPSLKRHQVKQIFICDDSYKGAMIDGVPVIGIEELEQHKNALMVLCGTAFYKLYCKILGYVLSDFYSKAQLMEDGFYRQLYQERLQPFLRKRKDELILPGIEIPLTQKCTLRCKICTNCMQYFRQPQAHDPTLMERAVEKILNAVDGISTFKLLGGEPLLEQKGIRAMMQLTAHLAQDKIIETTVVTNGTLLFEEETLRQLQTDPTSLVILSNYGKLSCRQNQVIEQLQAHGIPYNRFSNHTKWMDVGPLKPYHLPEQTVQQKFQACASKISCCTLWNGKLFVCPVAAQGVSLDAIPLVEGEYVDVLRPGKTPEELRAEIDQLYHRERFVTACDWCDRSETRCTVPAEQAAAPLDYPRYTSL